MHVTIQGVLRRFTQCDSTLYILFFTNGSKNYTELHFHEKFNFFNYFVINNNMFINGEHCFLHNIENENNVSENVYHLILIIVPNVVKEIYVYLALVV